MKTASTPRSFDAIVLCGGKSTRMGFDKVWLSFGEETFLQRICRKLSEEAHRVIAVAGVNQDLPELPKSVFVVRDSYPEQGPLGGFLTGLEALHDRPDDDDRQRPVWLSSCDAPFFNTDIVHILADRLGSHQAVAVRHQSRVNPLSAVYRHDVRSKVRRLFESGSRRMQDLLELLQAEIMDSEELRLTDPELALLFGVNTPEELQKAEDLYAKLSAGAGITKSKLQ